MFGSGMKVKEEKIHGWARNFKPESNVDNVEREKGKLV